MQNKKEEYLEKLRDEFAGKIAQGFVSRYTSGISATAMAESKEEIAYMAYALADELIKRR